MRTTIRLAFVALAFAGCAGSQESTQQPGDATEGTVGEVQAERGDATTPGLDADVTWQGSCWELRGAHTEAEGARTPGIDDDAHVEECWGDPQHDAGHERAENDMP